MAETAGAGEEQYPYIKAVLMKRQAVDYLLKL